MSDFEVRGADDFLKLSKALKQAGRTGKGSLRNELHAGMKAAVKPMLPKAQKALAAGLPSGGLAQRGAKVKQVVKVKTGQDAGITVGVAFGKRGSGLGVSNARLANRVGQIRHPLFGSREHWYSTAVPGARGWFDDTYRNAAPQVRPELEATMQRIIDKIVREAR